MTDTRSLDVRLGMHLQWCIRQHRSSFIGAFMAPERVQLAMNKVIDIVAEMEGWLQPVNYTHSNFVIANQTLYLRHAIMVDIIQRPYANPNPLEEHVDVDCEKYTKLYFDLAPSAIDGY